MRLLISSRARYYRESGNHECKEANRFVECRYERAPGSYERGDEPRSEQSRFSGIHESSHSALGGAVKRVYQAPVGSSAYESTLREAASICRLFQCVERLEGGQELKVRSRIRSRALDNPKRVYTRSNVENV